MIKLSIIGSAGRKNDIKYVKPEHLYIIIKNVKNLIENKLDLDPTNVHLVSGGAAWVDHIAVRLYLEGYVKKLTIYSPCKWGNGKYHENGEHRDNPGRSANFYHGQFIDIMRTVDRNFDSMKDIYIATRRGAVFDDSSHGFKNRNIRVASSDILLAFTYEPSSKFVKKYYGGTVDTYRKCKKLKYHYNILDLK